MKVEFYLSFDRWTWTEKCVLQVVVADQPSERAARRESSCSSKYGFWFCIQNPNLALVDGFFCLALTLALVCDSILVSQGFITFISLK
jgi:hypothetical protein